MSALRLAMESPQTSKIVVYQEEFIQILKAAAKVATNKDPYDVVQFRWEPDAELLHVCAVNAKTSFVGTMSVEMGDVLDRDMVFEIEKARIAGIVAMRFPKGQHETPLLGLIVAESWLEITDESGLGIGVHKLRLPRSLENAIEGDPRETIKRAVAAARSENLGVVRPYPEQLQTITAVAKAAGGQVRLQQLLAPEGAQVNPNRILATSSYWSMTVTALPDGDAAEASDEADQPDIDLDDQDELDFEAEDEDEADQPQARTIRIVEARPPKDGA